MRSQSDNDEWQSYLDEWRLLFNKLKQSFDSEYDVFAKKLVSSNNEHEIYVYNQSFKNLNSEYVYHFDIERILERTKHLDYKYITIKRLANIADYTKIELDKYKPKREPMILCPFLLPEFSYIVIDGNVRLNYRIQMHKLFGKIIIHKMMSKDDFIFSLDWLMYWFVNDVNYICKYKNTTAFTSLLRQSPVHYASFHNEVNRVIL